MYKYFRAQHIFPRIIIYMWGILPRSDSHIGQPYSWSCTLKGILPRCFLVVQLLRFISISLLSGSLISLLCHRFFFRPLFPYPFKNFYTLPHGSPRIVASLMVYWVGSLRTMDESPNPYESNSMGLSTRGSIVFKFSFYACGCEEMKDSPHLCDDEQTKEALRIPDQRTCLPPI